MVASETDPSCDVARATDVEEEEGGIDFLGAGSGRKGVFGDVAASGEADPEGPGADDVEPRCFGDDAEADATGDTRKFCTLMTTASTGATAAAQFDDDAPVR